MQFTDAPVVAGTRRCDGEPRATCRTSHQFIVLQAQATASSSADDMTNTAISRNGGAGTRLHGGRRYVSASLPTSRCAACAMTAARSPQPRSATTSSVTAAIRSTSGQDRSKAYARPAIRARSSERSGGLVQALLLRAGRAAEIAALNSPGRRTIPGCVLPTIAAMRVGMPSS
jgi:hypothetical protein